MRVVVAAFLVAAGLLLGGCGIVDETPPAAIDLHVRRADADGVASEQVVRVSPRVVGVVVVDVWDSHWDPVAAARVEALVAPLNESLDAARALGMTVIIAAADVPLAALHPAPEQRLGLAVATPPAFPGNGFGRPPLVLPFNSAHPDQTQVPPDVALPRSPQWTTLHPRLRVGPKDVVIDAERWTPAEDPQGWDGTAFRELYSAAWSRGLTHLVFAGVHSNWSVPTKSFGMINMKRAGFTVLLARDLSDAFTANGVDWTQRPPRADASLAPDEGARLVNAYIEETFDGTLDSSDWVGAQDRGSYSAAVAREPGLLGYWRLDGEGSPRVYLDRQRTASAWGDDRVVAGVPGAVRGTGTSIRLRAEGGLVVAPMYREDLPPVNPLVSLSGGPLTVEAWVSPETGDGWVFAHDGGTPDTLDVRLGLRGGRLRLEARGGAVALSGRARVPAGRWTHIAAVQDPPAGRWRLFVDGVADGEVAIAGNAVSTTAAVLVGATGPVNVADGEPGEARDGRLLSAGSEGFRGAVDEVAVYRSALSQRVLESHAKMRAR